MTPGHLMRLTYDPEGDALGLTLHPDSSRAPSRMLTDDVIVDIDPEGRLTAIEVLNASRYYPPHALLELESPESWLTLSEAALREGLAPATLRKQIANGRLRAVKRGRDWLVSGTDLWNYLESRAPQGRPPVSGRPRRRRRRRKV